jgi:hypothetical protein
MRLGCVLTLGFFISVPAHAALLGLSSQMSEYPDLYSSILTASFTLSGSGTDGVLAVNGSTSEYTTTALAAIPDFDDVYDAGEDGPGSFTLTATVKTNGVLESGSFSISGQLVDDGTGDPVLPFGVLLQGTITAFGYQANTSPESEDFDIKYTVTGGALAGDYGATAGTLLYGTSFGGSFTSNFNTDGDNFSSYSDTKAIPEPSSILLVVTSLLGLCGVVRRMPVRKC